MQGVNGIGVFMIMEASTSTAVQNVFIQQVIWQMCGIRLGELVSTRF